MKKYIYTIVMWFRKLTEGILIMNDVAIAVHASKLSFLGMSRGNITFACKEFYRQQKFSSYLPIGLRDIAHQFFKKNGDAIDSHGTFSFNRFEVFEVVDDETVYKELPTGYEVFDIEETLVLIAEIIMLWISSKKSGKGSALSVAVSECGFFMIDGDEVLWTIRMLKNNGHPIVLMDMFNETDIIWPEHTVVLSPLSGGDENYLHSLES